jgi:hypothetical protein
MSAFHVRNPVARSGSLGGIWSRHGTFHETTNEDKIAIMKKVKINKNSRVAQLCGRPILILVPTEFLRDGVYNYIC